jgi:L-cysteine desulfidase
MKPETMNAYVAILEEELVLATGCTEPIAIAYAAAKLRETLGWKSRMNIGEAVRASAVWSKEVLRDGADARAVSDRQIRAYFERYLEGGTGHV